MKTPDPAKGQSPYEGYFSRIPLGLEAVARLISEAESLARGNPAFRKIFEEEAFEFLQVADPDYFYGRFNGQRDPDGYLLDREGNPTDMLPSQQVNRGIECVAEQALRKYNDAMRS